MSKKDLTQKQLKEYLHYDPETGVFTNLKTGEPIGWKGWKGYCSVSVYDVTHRAHRLAWLYMKGEWPTQILDHKDGDKSNNRFANLREATFSQNSANGHSKRVASDLPRGVRKSPKSSSFKSEISVKGRKVHLGCFKTPEEAHEVYQLASELIYGEHSYHLSRAAIAASAAQGEA